MQDKIHGVLFTVGFLMIGGGFFGSLAIGWLGLVPFIVGIIMVVAGEVRNKNFKNEQNAKKLSDVSKVIESKEQREKIKSELQEELKEEWLDKEAYVLGNIWEDITIRKAKVAQHSFNK